MEVTSKCDEFFLWFMTVSYEISISFFFLSSLLFECDYMRKYNSHRGENVSSKISVISDSKN